ncbi:MAG TPA: hypothetical protein VGF70_06895 [Solirubrobacteraceae bacterium]|jgi:hypothetical protein
MADGTLPMTTALELPGLRITENIGASEIGQQFTEIVAYGTAVKTQPGA